MISICLQGHLPIDTIDMVIKQTNLMFDSSTDIRAPDILILYQQRIISVNFLNELIQQFYKDEEFYNLSDVWINPEIIQAFKNTKYIPVLVNYETNTITAASIPEFRNSDVPIINTFSISTVNIKLYEYVNLYIKYYGYNPSFLKELPVSDIFSMIIKEALYLNASDITISEKENYIEIYYNVNKRKIYSKRCVPINIMNYLVKFLMAQSNSTSSIDSHKIIYFTLNLDKTHRGRTVINYTYYGHTITIRVLSNLLHKHNFKSLSIPDNVQEFLNKYYVNISPGLKLLAGPTYSGKNTTIITILDEIHKQNDVKIVSIENPVEILTNYIEQINTETADEFKESVASTLRQNPDIVYIAEMNYETALETMKIANTGKQVLSTIHVNNIAEVPLRIKDITNMEISEIISILDSIVYQELLPKKCSYCNDNGCDNCYKAGVVPIFSYLHINNKLKKELIGKNISEIYKIIEKHISNDNQIEDLYNAGIISRKTYEARKRD